MTVRELTAAPNLLGLYGKAVLGGLRGGGGDLPGTEYVRADVRTDPAHLADYARVCGFRFTDTLPATYPHLAAFGLQLALMTEPGFPFPLLGLVHVANRITQHRPIGIDEATTVRVRAENLRPHDRGTQFDMVSEARVSGSDTPVWTETSTYLRRGGGRSPGARRTELAPPAPVALWRVPADTGRRYAEVSGDRNPIHLHPLTARAFGFPAAIAHGMWTKARALASFEGRLPEAYRVEVHFAQPVLLPARVGFTDWRTDAGWAFELWKTGGKPKPHLRGSIDQVD